VENRREAEAAKRGSPGESIVVTHSEAYVRAMNVIGNISDRLRQEVEADTYKALLRSRRSSGKSIRSVFGLFRKDTDERFLNADFDIAIMLDHLLSTIDPKNDGAKKRTAEELLSMDEGSA